MAQVIDIRSCCFDDEAVYTVTVGKCSVCEKKLISQEDYGFPTICPYCDTPLENGTDDREWIRKILSTTQRTGT
jgi:hypothetical protein